MMHLHMLEEYKKSGEKIRVAIVGAGQMGEGLTAQIELMDAAIEVTLIADIRPGVAAHAFRSAGVDDAQVVETNSIDVAADAIRQHKRVATTNANMISNIERISIVVEATGIPNVGAEVARDAILHQQHVLQMNVETDATVGYMLRKMADAAGVVYTLTSGDEPGATMELYDFAKTLGFDIVCVGKGKNNPLDRGANPTTVEKKAAAQHMNPKMLASFVDGTKTMVEMTSLANAVGFVPDVCGMHGPEVTPKTIDTVFVPRDAGGVITETGRVEYGIGIAPGVFVVFTAHNPKIVRDLKYLNLGKGPYWALYRPYHLANLETPISIIRAVVNHATTMATLSPPTAETVTYAKRDLCAGDCIDYLGGYTVYGMIERADTACAKNLLPLGLAPGAQLIRDVSAHRPITYEDVGIDESLAIVQLRRMQDQIILKQQEQNSI